MSRQFTEPFQTGKAVKENDRSDDPFVYGKKLYDLNFLNVLLIPRLEKQMRATGQFKDREDLVKSGGATVAGQLQAAFKTQSGATGASNDYDNVKDMRFRYPNELNLLVKAFSLRNDGHSDTEILEALAEKE